MYTVHKTWQKNQQIIQKLKEQQQKWTQKKQRNQAC